MFRIVVALIALGLVLYLLRWVLVPFVISGVIAYICSAPIEWLARRTRLPRSLFAIATFVILIALAAIAVLVAGPPVVERLLQFVLHLRDSLQDLLQMVLGETELDVLGYPVSASQISDSIAQEIRSWVLQGANLLKLAGWSLAGVFGLFLTAVLLFYFLLGGPRLARMLLWVIPPVHRPLVERIWLRLDPVLRRYFVGVVAVVIYAGLAAYIGLGLILGLRHAPLLAVTTGVLEVIPIIGPGAAIVITALAAVQYSKGIWAIAGFAIYATVLRLSIDQLVGPLVLGQAARLHPTLIIFCFIAGATLFGPIGVVLSVPIALAIRAALITIYEDRQES